MFEAYGVVSVQVAPVAGWIWWLPDSSGPQSLMSAVKPATVGDGNVPGGVPEITTPSTIWLGVLIELMKSQLSFPSAFRKSTAMLLGSGLRFTDSSGPSFHAWKQ